MTEEVKARDMNTDERENEQSKADAQHGDAIKRHPLAVAWDDWIASDEGQHCRAPNAALARESPYLENRLHRAFDAGVKAAALQAEAPT